MKYYLTKNKCLPVSTERICKPGFQPHFVRLQNALDADPLAVALAAPQIGWDAQVFIVRKMRDIGGIYINPVIKPVGDELIAAREGCRSLPCTKQVIKTRHKTVHMTWINIRGEEQARTFHGYAARIIQHETDHLKGVMIND